eukprot:scaffold993_cov393-Prasinococcus_capsulatus_cf.AAC.19
MWRAMPHWAPRARRCHVLDLSRTVPQILRARALPGSERKPQAPPGCGASLRRMWGQAVARFGPLCLGGKSPCATWGGEVCQLPL